MDDLRGVSGIRQPPGSRKAYQSLEIGVEKSSLSAEITSHRVGHGSLDTYLESASETKIARNFLEYRTLLDFNCPLSFLILGTQPP